MHGQNQFGNSRVSVWNWVWLPYQHTLLISCVQGSVSLSQVRARVRRSLLSQRQKLPEIWSRWCWWSWCRCPTAGDISTRRRKRDWKSERASSVRAAADKAIGRNVVANIVKKKSINWIILFYIFGSGCLSVHIRFSTYFPCHFRAQLLFFWIHTLFSIILRQNVAQILICQKCRFLLKRDLSWFNLQINPKDFLKNRKYKYGIVFVLLFWSTLFCSLRDIFTSVWNEVRENEYPSSGGNTSIWHVHSFTTNRKCS